MANIYDAAKLAYKDCINDLTVMGKATEQVMAKHGKTFNTRILLNQFDILLQYSLLQIALADGHLAGEELSFIMELVEYCDFPEFLKTQGYKNATWQVIYNTQEQKLNSIVAEAEDDVVKMSADFVNIFSAFDTAADYDYFEDLKRNISIIIAATCQSDGEMKDSEIEQGCLIFGIMSVISQRIGNI